MATASTVETKFTADTSDLSAKLETISGQLAGLKTKTSDVAKGVALGTAAWNIFQDSLEKTKDFITSTIESYTNFQAELAKFDEAASHSKEGLKSYSDVLENEVNRALSKTAFSEEEVTNAMSRLATTGATSAQASKTLEIAMDAAAGSGESLDAIISDLEETAGGRLGTQFTMLGLNMTEVKNSADKMADVLKQLSEKYFGDAAKQAQTLQGRTQQLKNNFDAIKVTIAEQLVPQLNSALSSVLGLTTNINDNTQSQTQLQQGIYQTVEFLKMLGDGILIILNTLGSLATGIIEIPTLMGAWAYDIATQISKVGDYFKVLWDNIKIGAKNAFSGTKEQYEKFPSITFDATQGMITQFNDMQLQFNSNIKKSADKMASDWNGAFNLVGFQYHDIFQDMVNQTGNAMTAANNSVSGISAKMQTTLIDFMKSIDNAVSQHADKMQSINQQITDAQQSYQENNQSAIETEKDQIAQVVKTHQDKAKQLEQSLAQETMVGKQQNQAKIEQDKQALQTELDFLKQHAADVAAVQTQLNTDDIDKIKNKFNEEETKRKEAYDKQMKSLQDQLSKEQDAYQKSLTDIGDKYRTQFDSIKTYIQSTASPKIVAAFQQMVSLVNAQLDQIKMPAIPTGLVGTTAKHTVSAHKESQVANKALTTVKNSSKTVNIHFNGPMSVATPSDRESLAKTIQKHIMMTNESALLGQEGFTQPLF